ncbi:hypothetical protein OPT61_g10145 [Boeremia exigua]|uniref:Uncharacterized protein n=1 Tax=Boeremia exigua TaxID=749465 RepID=A0ACC2HR53_9PLEO|nr:hypothetical protein OPT61_g10145 [Boeremia exigua]
MLAAALARAASSRARCAAIGRSPGKSSGGAAESWGMDRGAYAVLAQGSRERTTAITTPEKNSDNVGAGVTMEAETTSSRRRKSQDPR